MRRVFACLLAALMLCVGQGAAAEGFFGFQPVREYQGARYEARPAAETTTILLIGYDHDDEGEIAELHGYSGGGQADFLLLVVLDHRYDRIHLLQIDRDTMTRVRVMDSNGFAHDRSSLQICLAHAYGDTREANNANTVLAVETLLGIEAPDDGVGIDWYIAMDISGISRLNDLLGGVTVTIETDLTEIDPAMTAGATLTLTGRQAERFCRARYGVGDQTNASRMIRQRQYMTAAGEQLMALIRRDPDFGGDVLDGMGVLYDRTVASSGGFNFGSDVAEAEVGDPQGYWLMTNALRRTIISALSRAVGYELMDVDTLPGVHTRGSDGYIRFDLEEGAAIEWALDIFYLNRD